MRTDRAMLCVALDYRGHTYAHTIEIGGPYLEAFAPVDRCDDLAIQAIFSRTPPRELQRVLKQRPEFAKELANIMSKVLLQIMENRDLKNGHIKKESRG